MSMNIGIAGVSGSTGYITLISNPFRGTEDSALWQFISMNLSWATDNCFKYP